MAERYQFGDRVYSPRFGRGQVVRHDPAAGLVLRLEDGQEITIRDPAAMHLEKIEERAIAPIIHRDEGEEEVMTDREDLRRMLVEALEEVMGPAEADLGDRWRGGMLLLKPGKSDTQSKEIPLDKFFQKIVRLRDQLRVLEQKINSNPKLDDADKVAMQQYITRCYGSLTTFNVLFKRAPDRFHGSGGD